MELEDRNWISRSEPNESVHGWTERTLFLAPDCPRRLATTAAGYVLHRRVYQGKASALYRASCRQSGSTVALKSYAKRRLSALNWAQVEREIRLHGALRHPAIVPLYAAFEDGESIHLVMEYAAGGDVFGSLRAAGGRFDEAQCLHVIRACLSALSYLHARGIIHRDIKPENLVLTGDGAVKLADFGLSICCLEERPVTRAGTLDFMPPEVLRCPQKQHPRENKGRADLEVGLPADLWCVGVLAFELLTGRPPFEDESKEETAHRIRSEAPAFPLGVPPPAVRFISQALQKTPSKRGTVASLQQHEWVAQGPGAPVIEQAAAPPASAAGHRYAGVVDTSGSGRDSQATASTHAGSSDSAESLAGGAPLLAPAAKSKAGPSGEAGGGEAAAGAGGEQGIMASASKLFAKLLGLGSPPGAQPRESSRQGQDFLIKAGRDLTQD